MDNNQERKPEEDEIRMDRGNGNDGVMLFIMRILLYGLFVWTVINILKLAHYYSLVLRFYH